MKTEIIKQAVSEIQRAANFAISTTDATKIIERTLDRVEGLGHRPTTVCPRCDTRYLVKVSDEDRAMPYPFTFKNTGTADAQPSQVVVTQPIGQEKWYHEGAVVYRVGDDALRFEAWNEEQAYDAVERHNASLSQQPSGQEKWIVQRDENDSTSTCWRIFERYGRCIISGLKLVQADLIVRAHNASLSQQPSGPNNKIFDHKWLDIECVANGCQSLFVKELRALIGQPPEGSHPDEWKPRAETWHQERLNWQAEVERLRSQPSGQDADSIDDVQTKTGLDKKKIYVLRRQLKPIMKRVLDILRNKRRE